MSWGENIKKALPPVRQLDRHLPGGEGVAGGVKDCIEEAGMREKYIPRRPPGWWLNPTEKDPRGEKKQGTHLEKWDSQQPYQKISVLHA